MKKSIKLKDILGNKPVLLLDGAQPVSEALRIMHEHGRNAVGIMSDNVFKGIFTSGDFIRRVVAGGYAPHATPVSKVMTTDPLTVLPDCGADEAFDIMSRCGYSHLPVLRAANELVGIVSQSDLRDEISKTLREKTQEARLLRAYAFGEAYGVGPHY